ncbi:MAG: DUF948 domain-containing protein [bacterium]|nr:DUF948 domain-containing protein [Candidatus Kapabacteria bacterium]
MEDVFQVVLYIAASIALLALAWLFMSLVNTVKSARAVLDNTNKTVETLVGEVQGIRTSLQGTIENVEVITARVPATLDHVNSQLGQVDGILGSVRQLTEGVAIDVARLTSDATDIVHAAKGVVISLIDLEQDIQVKVQRPIVELMSIFSALGKGIHAFRMKIAGTGDPHALIDASDDDSMYEEYESAYDDDDDDGEDVIDDGLDDDLVDDFDGDLADDLVIDEVEPPTKGRVAAYRS